MPTDSLRLARRALLLPALPTGAALLLLLLAACDSAPSAPHAPAAPPPQIESLTYQPDTVRADSLPPDAFPDSTTARVPLTMAVDVAATDEAVGRVQYVVDRPRERETLADGVLDPLAPGRYRAADTLALPLEDARYRVIVFATGSGGRLGGEARGTVIFLVGDSTAAP